MWNKKVDSVKIKLLKGRNQHGYSFPSGHSQFAASEYGTLAWLYRKKKVFAAGCVILLALIVFSRNFLGYHTPQDVVIGVLVGIGATILLSYVFDWMDQKEGRDILFVIISIVLYPLLMKLVQKKKRKNV